MFMTASPLITIGILCYNAKDTIGRAIESALGQDWDNTEILVVDDGSTDGSAQIVESLARRHRNIRLVRHEKNCGCPTARNTVLQEARGEYIAFFDDDDWSYPQRISEQYNRLVNYECDSDIVLCYCTREVVPLGGDEPVRNIKGAGYAPEEPHGEVVARYILLHIFGSLNEAAFSGYTWGEFGTCTFMASKTALNEVGLFDTNFFRLEDLDYAIRAGLAGGHCVSVDNVLMRQYKTVGEDKNYGRFLPSRLRILAKYNNVLPDEGLSGYMRIMAYAQAHESADNKWRFKLFRSIAKRWLKMTRLLRKI